MRNQPYGGTQPEHAAQYLRDLADDIEAEPGCRIGIHWQQDVVETIPADSQWAEHARTGHQCVTVQMYLPSCDDHGKEPE